MNETGGSCSSDVEGRCVYRVLVGKPEGNSSSENRVVLCGQT
jgi:hypothetical protein